MAIPYSVIAPDEYQIFTEIFGGDRYRFDLSRPTIADETSVHYQPCADWIYAPLRFRYLPKRNPELISDFEAKNRCAWRLERRFHIANGFQFLSERNDLKEQPSHVYTVSRVGFDRENTYGLVYLCYYGGPLCARAHFMLMKRDRDAWREIDCMLAWMS